ncbi:TetR/AcrR family transcriptional regulator [Muricomes intestini]|jgi:AcrR family transcriptional regulator
MRFGVTGVQDIADEAGISIGLLYRHYKTKEEFFSGVVSYAVEGLNTLCDLMNEQFTIMVYWIAYNLLCSFCASL